MNPDTPNYTGPQQLSDFTSEFNNQTSRPAIKRIVHVETLLVFHLLQKTKSLTMLFLFLVLAFIKSI